MLVRERLPGGDVRHRPSTRARQEVDTSSGTGKEDVGVAIRTERIGTTYGFSTVDLLSAVLSNTSGMLVRRFGDVSQITVRGVGVTDRLTVSAYTSLAG